MVMVLMAEVEPGEVPVYATVGIFARFSSKLHFAWFNYMYAFVELRPLRPKIAMHGCACLYLGGFLVRETRGMARHVQVAELLHASSGWIQTVLHRKGQFGLPGSCSALYGEGIAWLSAKVYE